LEHVSLPATREPCQATPRRRSERRKTRTAQTTRLLTEKHLKAWSAHLEFTFFLRALLFFLASSDDLFASFFLLLSCSGRRCVDRYAPPERKRLALTERGAVVRPTSWAVNPQGYGFSCWTVAGVAILSVRTTTPDAGHVAGAGVVGAEPATFNTDVVLVGVVIFAAVGMITLELLTQLERRFDKWRPRPGNRA
jgi:hypothetical protein